MNHRVGDGAKVLGALRSVLKDNSMSVRVKMDMFDGIVVLLEICGYLPWVLNVLKKEVGGYIENEKFEDNIWSDEG